MKQAVFALFFFIFIVYNKVYAGACKDNVVLKLKFKEECSKALHVDNVPVIARDGAIAGTCDFQCNFLRVSTNLMSKNDCANICKSKELMCKDSEIRTFSLTACICKNCPV